MDFFLGFLLLLAVGWDFATRRIPNWLTFGVAMFGVMIHAINGGLAGTVAAIVGLLVGLCCFLPSYLFGGLGGGDVKLMAAAGAFLGPYNAVVAALSAIIAGGALALARIGWRGGLKAWAVRHGTMAMALVSTRRFIYLAPAKDEPAAEPFPYALAIATGVVFALAWSGMR